jgi:ankyrin repeat protein
MEIEVLLELIELILTQRGEVEDFVETIVKKKFVVDEGTLFIATQMRQIELVRFILRSGIKPTLESFQYAAEHEFFELCSLFVEFGSREILSTPELERELITAIYNNHVTLVKLINQGVDPTTDNNRIILSASANNNFEILRLLLKHGADPTASNNYAIKWASYRGQLEIVRLLLKNDSKYKVNPKAGNNYAIKNVTGPDRDEIIKLLEEYGASF